MARPIRKAALVEDLATEAGSSETTAREFLDALAKVVSQRLVAGDTVALPDLAKFETRDRPARQVRSPATGEMVDKDANKKDANKAVSVRAATGLKAAVNAWLAGQMAAEPGRQMLSLNGNASIFTRPGKP